MTSSLSKEPVALSLAKESVSFDVQVYIDQTAALLGLQISPELRPSVVENFERIMEIAQPVLDFELPDNLESATSFEP